MRIGIDIDGIILDFERTMRTYAELYDFLILGKDGVINYKEFDYLKRYNWSEEERKRFINEYLVYATINSTPLIPLVKEMLELLKIEDIDYCFITARGLLKKETQQAVIQVFEKNNLPIDNIYWAVKDKVLKCQELGIDVMIEDNPSTCKLLASNNIKTLYFRDKGNEIISNNDYLKEVSNIGEICRYIFTISGLNNSKDVYEKVLLKKKEDVNNE